MSRPIAIIICLFLILILGIGLVAPKYQDLNLLQLRVKEKEIKVQSEKEYFSELSSVSEKLKSCEESLSKIDSSLPADPQLPDLFNFLQKTTAQSGLVLKGMSPASTNSVKREGWDPEIQETGTNLIVAGSYTSFKNYLSILEKTARMIELESISFLGPSESGATPGSLIDFNLRIKTYSY